MVRVSRGVKGLLVGVATILLISVVIPLILTAIYKQRIIEAVRAQFAQQSGQVLEPFDVGFSLVRHFPYLSVQFKQVSVLDTSAGVRRQVLAVEQAQFVINGLDLLREQGQVRKIIVKGFQFRQWVDKQGHRTTFAWKAQGRRQPAQLPRFHIPELRFEDAVVTVENAYKQSAFAVAIDEADLQAESKGALIQFEGALTGKILQVSIRKRTLFRNQVFSADAHYVYDPARRMGIIQPSKLTANNSLITVSGRHTRLDNQIGSDVDIQLAGSQPGYALLSLLLADSLASNNPGPNGRLAFQYRMQGAVGPTIRPHTRLSFDFAARKLRWPKTSVVLDEVLIKGSLDNGPRHSAETSTLQLDQFRVRGGTNTVTVVGKMTNLTAPVVEGNVGGQVRVRDLAGMLNWPGDSLYGGTVRLNMAVKTPLPRAADSLARTPIQPYWHGGIQIRDGSFQFANPQQNCSNLNADLYFVGNNDRLRLNHITGQLNGRPFRLDGEVSHLLRYWLSERPMRPRIQAKLVAQWPEIDFSKGLNEKPPGPNHPQLHHPDSLLTALIAGTDCSVMLQIGKVKLPSDENMNQMALQLRKEGDEVSLSRIAFRTTLGGRGIGLGRFRWKNGKVQSPYLALQLSYQNLYIQRLLRLMAGLQSVSASGPKRTAEKTVVDYRADLEVKARKIAYRALNGSNFQLKAIVEDDKVNLERLRMQAFGGRMSANGTVKLDRSLRTYPLELVATLRETDLQQLFRAAEELKLDLLGSNNIRGKVDCSITLQTKLDKDYLPDFPETVAYTRASLRGMELIEVVPIKQALHFLREEKTGHIYFEDVEARFMLSRNRFLIPGINLTSNISYLNLGGDYTLNKDALFYVDVSVLQALFGNNRRRIRRIQQAEAGRLSGSIKSHLLLRRVQEKYQVKVLGKREIEARRQELWSQLGSELARQKMDTTFVK